MSTQQNKQKLLFNILKNKYIFAFILLTISLILCSILFFPKQNKETVLSTVHTISPTTYTNGKVHIFPLKIQFSAPVAKLDLLDKTIRSENIKMFPTIAGEWKWISQSVLTFTPNQDWIPDTNYQIELSKEIFDSSYTIHSLKYQANTPSFKAEFENENLYEKPNSFLKQVTATLQFSHPVQPQSVMENLEIHTASGRNYSFNATSTENNRLFHITTEPVTITSEDDFIYFSVKNVQNIYQKTLKDTVISEKIKIPNSSDIFTLLKTETFITYNEEKDNEAEQILSLNFSLGVHRSNLKNSVQLYEYIGDCYDLKDLNKQAILNHSKTKPISYTALPLKNDVSSTHLFKYKITNTNHCLIATVKEGVVSADGFVLNAPYFKKLNIAPLPIETKIAFDGSLMSLKSDKRLNIVTRGVKHLKATISRIPVDKINHLISQSNGDMKNLSFYNDIFDVDNIAENFYEDVFINNQYPEKRNYSSIDLNKYLQNKKGIFYAEIVDADTQDYYPTKDGRLILITNLGIIAKYNDKNESIVYVSDFEKQQPVQNAKVQIISKNGSVLFSRYTDKNGMVQFPDLKDFKREKTPVAYLVTTQNDLSFMPINNNRLNLYYGNFNTDGENISNNEDIKAFVFTDRGIYRPNEIAHFGIIVKNGDLKTPIGNKIKIEIQNNNGDVVMIKSFKVPKGGMFETTYTIPLTANLGTYQATLTTNTNDYETIIGETSFKVAEFEPDTMKMNVHIQDFNGNGWIKSDNVKAIATLTNLYGVPASDYKIKSEIDIYPTTFKFEQYKNYKFDTPKYTDNNISSTPTILKETYTDEKGKAIIDIPLNNYQAGTYRLYLTNTGFEKAGGRSVSAHTTALFSPYDILIGYKTDTELYSVPKNEKVNLHLIAIDNTLKQTPQKDLTLEVWQKENISQLVKQQNGLYKYQTVEKDIKIKSMPIIISKNGLSYSLDTSKSGKYYIQIKKENQPLLEIDYRISGSENVTFELTKKAQLDVSLNKKTYTNGDTVEMQITAPYTGYGLITIEKEKVYSSKWFKTDKNSTKQSIILPKEITGNAYINVMFIRDNNSEEIFISPLSYAVEPVFIDKAKQTLQIELNVPKIIKPSETLTVKYKGSHTGKIILYGVDSGILNYAHYKLPEPLNYFVPKTRLGVSTEQIMDLILPNANVFKVLSTTGGDSSSLINKHRINPFARKTDKPVAFFSPVLDIDETTRTYTYQVPDNFNGQITIMAIAVNEERIGSTQTKTFVQSDFVLKPALPFNVAPNDVFEAGITITNLTQFQKPLETKIELKTSEHFEIIGETQKTITLNNEEEKSIQFKVKTKNILGSGHLTFIANAKQFGSQNIAHIGVRPAMPYTTDIQLGYTDGTIKLSDFVKTFYPYASKQEIIASTSPLVILPSLIDYLDKYPYICTEQFVSKVFPKIILLFEHPTLVNHTDVYNQFDEIINILRTRQNWNGGISLYNGQENENVFASVYAYHFLSTAKKYDFNVPEQMFNQLTRYIRTIASQQIYSEDDAIHSAYATYLLSSNGFITTNYLIHLEEEINRNKLWEKSIANIYLASAYHLLGNEKKAYHFWKKYQITNDLVTDLPYVYLTAKHFEKEFNQIKDKISPALVQKLNKTPLNSLTAAYGILAFSSYPNTKENDKQIHFTTNTNTSVSYNDFAKMDFKNSDEKLTIHIKSKNPYYYNIIQQGYPIKPITTAKANGIRIVKEIQNLKGEKITTAKVGDTVIVKLKMNTLNDKYVSDVAVVDLYAGCFELMEDSISVKNYTDYSTYLQSKELREDRAVFYLDLDKNAVEISYRVKVIAKGQFIVPPASVQALYDMIIYGNTPTEMFVVDE